MPKKSEVIENLNWVTERISDRVWTISVGVIAVSLTYIVESASGTATPFLGPRQVAIPAALALLALVCDLTQYMAANRQNLALLQRMEAGREGGAFRARFAVEGADACLPGKVVALLAAVLWVVVLTSARAIELMRTAP